MLPAKNLRSETYGFKYFKDFLLKNVKLWGRANFGLGVIVLTNLIGDHKLMQHAKYQRSGPYSYREEDF